MEPSSPFASSASQRWMTTLVRLAPRPEAHGAGPGEGPDRRVLGRGGEHVGETPDRRRAPTRSGRRREAPRRPWPRSRADRSIGWSRDRSRTAARCRCGGSGRRRSSPGTTARGRRGRLPRPRPRGGRCSIGSLRRRRRTSIDRETTMSVPALRDRRGMRWDAGVTDIPTRPQRAALGYGAVMLVVFLWGSARCSCARSTPARSPSPPPGTGSRYRSRCSSRGWRSRRSPGGSAPGDPRRPRVRDRADPRVRVVPGNVARHRRGHRRDHTARHRDRRGAAVRRTVDAASRSR